jgi:hypothetical protein
MTKYQDNLKKYSKKQLIEIVREFNHVNTIRQYSTLRKSDLINKISEHKIRVLDNFFDEPKKYKYDQIF